MIITIIVAEQPKGLYTASLLSGEFDVKDSSDPLRPAARKLLETGQAQADDVLEMKRAGGPVDMRGIVGKLAQQSVREDLYVGPIVVKHRSRQIDTAPQPDMPFPESAKPVEAVSHFVGPYGPAEGNRLLREAAHSVAWVCVGVFFQSQTRMLRCSRR